MGRARWLAPVVVSVGLLGFLLVRLDVGRGLTQLTLRSAALLAPLLVAYGAATLWLEALSLVRLFPGDAGPGTWRCARIKAATYPLALLHYAVGGAALALLVRRWTGGISQAMGIVLLVSVVDLGVLLLLTACGAAWLATETPVLRAGALAAALVVIALGLVALRVRIPLESLERLRGAALLQAARNTRSLTLARLVLLRLGFVSAYVAVVTAALRIFGVSPPLGDVVVGAAAVALVAALPIAVAGLGTGQVAFVYAFRHWGDPDVLLACSLALSAGIILLRGLLGLPFAREITGAVRGEGLASVAASRADSGP